MFEANYYRDQKFACGNKKCDGILVPQQVREDRRDNEVRIYGKCPECGKTYKFDLSLEKAEVDKWQPLLNEQFNTCAKCGEKRSVKLLEVKGNPRKDYKVKVQCVECGKKDTRTIDGDLYFLLQGDLPPEDRVPIICPTCQKKLDDQDKTCPNCGREIFCDKCGAYIDSPQAAFCTRCGDKVAKGDFSKKSVTISKELKSICPNCGDAIREGQKFCTSCGQEVVCDKCNEPLVPGAIFCFSCGDKVKAGES